jgi:hypothetical protein
LLVAREICVANIELRIDALDEISFHPAGPFARAERNAFLFLRPSEWAENKDANFIYLKNNM